MQLYLTLLFYFLQEENAANIFVIKINIFTFTKTLVHGLRLKKLKTKMSLKGGGEVHCNSKNKSNVCAFKDYKNRIILICVI